MIPDVPFALQRQMQLERYLTNKKIINTELSRARGHTDAANFNDPVNIGSRASENIEHPDYAAGNMDDLELHTFTDKT